MATATVTEFQGEAAVVRRCWCSIAFAIPASLNSYYENANARAHGSFSLHCPLGHSMIPKRGDDVVALKDQLARSRSETDNARSDRDWWQARANSTGEELTRTTRRLTAHKGVVTKLRKRVGKGVCPCCHQKFKELRDHMKAEHPDWNPEMGAEAIAAKAKQ